LIQKATYKDLILGIAPQFLLLHLQPSREVAYQTKIRITGLRQLYRGVERAIRLWERCLERPMYGDCYIDFTATPV
jgi:hypothetical protein